LDAVEQEAVAQGLVVAVDDGAGAEQVCGYGEGEEFVGYFGGCGMRDVFVVGG